MIVKRNLCIVTTCKHVRILKLKGKEKKKHAKKPNPASVLSSGLAEFVRFFGSPVRTRCFHFFFSFVCFCTYGYKTKQKLYIRVNQIVPESIYFWLINKPLPLCLHSRLPPLRCFSPRLLRGGHPRGRTEPGRAEPSPRQPG